MKHLAELHRITQIALEMHRVDPDDEQTWRDYERVKAERDVAWLEEQMERVVEHDPDRREDGRHGPTVMLGFVLVYMFTLAAIAGWVLTAVAIL